MVIVGIFGIQLRKMTRLSKMQENTTHNKEKNKYMGKDPEIT